MLPTMACVRLTGRRRSVAPSIQTRVPDSAARMNVSAGVGVSRVLVNVESSCVAMRTAVTLPSALKRPPKTNARRMDRAPWVSTIVATLLPTSFAPLANAKRKS